MALAALSDVVVHAIVERVSVRESGPSGQPGIHTRIELRVFETLRGAPESERIVWVQGGRIGAQLRVVVGQARFVEGEEVLLFLMEGGGGLWPAGMARGRMVVRDAAVVDSNGESIQLGVVRELIAGVEPS